MALACFGLLLQATQDNFALPLLIGLRLGWVSALDLTRQLLTTLVTVVLVLAGATLVAVPRHIDSGRRHRARRHRRARARHAPTDSHLQLESLAQVRQTDAPLLGRARGLLTLFPGVDPARLAARHRRQLGYFSASFRIVEVLTAVPALLASSALPIFAHAARDDHDRLGYALGRVFEVSLIVGAWVSVSIAIGAPLAIAIVGGPAFKPAASVLALQGIGLGAMFVSLVWANGLLGLGLYRLILMISIGGLVLNSALVVPLVLIDGAQGAAIGTSTAEVVLAVVQCLAVVRRRPLLRPSLRIVPGVALAAALGLTPLALTGIPVIVRLVISTALFAGALLATRAYPPELIDLLPGLRARATARMP